MKAIEAQNEAKEAEIERQTAMIEKKKRIKELAAERLRAETGACVCLCVWLCLCVWSLVALTHCAFTLIYFCTRLYYIIYHRKGYGDTADYYNLIICIRQ